MKNYSNLHLCITYNILKNGDENKIWGGGEGNCARLSYKMQCKLLIFRK